MKKSNLCVFTTGNDLTLLRASAQRVTITLHEYETPAAGYVTMKLRRGVEFLSHRDEPYAMWVDGNDSLLLHPEDSIISRLSSMGEPTIISAEKNCWPDADKEGEYRKKDDRGIQHNLPRFLNAGGFIGPINGVLGAMHAAISCAESEDDQRAWTKAYLSGMLPHVQIDHARFIFASIGDGEEALRVDSCVKHWNGRTPGRQEYWESLNATA